MRANQYHRQNVRSVEKARITPHGLVPDNSAETNAIVAVGASANAAGTMLSNSIQDMIRRDTEDSASSTFNDLAIELGEFNDELMNMGGQQALDTGADKTGRSGVVYAGEKKMTETFLSRLEGVGDYESSILRKKFDPWFRGQIGALANHEAGQRVAVKNANDEAELELTVRDGLNAFGDEKAVEEKRDEALAIIHANPHKGDTVKEVEAQDMQARLWSGVIKNTSEHSAQKAMGVLQRHLGEIGEDVGNELYKFVRKDIIAQKVQPEVDALTAAVGAGKMSISEADRYLANKYTDQPALKDESRRRLGVQDETRRRHEKYEQDEDSESRLKTANLYLEQGMREMAVREIQGSDDDEFVARWQSVIMDKIGLMGSPERFDDLVLLARHNPNVFLQEIKLSNEDLTDDHRDVLTAMRKKLQTGQPISAGDDPTSEAQARKSALLSAGLSEAKNGPLVGRFYQAYEREANLYLERFKFRPDAEKAYEMSTRLLTDVYLDAWGADGGTSRALDAGTDPDKFGVMQTDSNWIPFLPGDSTFNDIGQVPLNDEMQLQAVAYEQYIAGGGDPSQYRALSDGEVVEAFRSLVMDARDAGATDYRSFQSRRLIEAREAQRGN